MIGSHLCQALLSRGIDVIATTRGNNRPIRLRHLSDAIGIVQLDITKPDQCHDTVGTTRPQIIFNLASTTFNPPPRNISDHMSVNFVGMCNLMDSLREFPESKLVFAGSAAAYGSGDNLSELCPDIPENQLGVSKACASVLVRASAKVYDTHALELRFFTPFGAFESPHRLIPAVIIAALTQRPLSLSEGRQQRDYVYIDDAVEALMMTMDKGVGPGTILNISSGQGRSIRSVANTIQDIMGIEIPLRWGEVPTRADEIWNLSGPFDKASSAMGWIPSTSFHDGLGATIDWYRSNLELALSLEHL
jgi:polyisoprenyl-phosphate glycosyltransferase